MKKPACHLARAWWLAFALLAASSLVSGRDGQTAPTASPEAAATSWAGRHAEIEAFLSTAEFGECREVGLGVTAPLRCHLMTDGPAGSFAWKKVHGRHLGFWDSYKAEIAAYELDKILGLDMVPPAVEKRVRGDPGVAVMWIEPARMWNVHEPIRGPDPVAWDRQVARMRMFDNLIGNTDRNQGNLLVDPACNLILIDHSRGFTSGRRLVVQMSRIDPELWKRIEALEPEDVEPVLRPWISRGQIRDIFRRRDAMRQAIDELVAAKGDLAFVR